MTPNRDPKPMWQFLLLFCLKPGGRNLTVCSEKTDSRIVEYP